MVAALTQEDREGGEGAYLSDEDTAANRRIRGGRAAQTAADIAEKTHSELHAVHVGEFMSTFFAHTEEESIELQRDAQRLLDEEAAKIQAANGEIADTHLRVGRPDEQIISVAEELGVGLIAMGSRGLGGIRRALMGSVSDSVVRHAHCPVLVVRPGIRRR